MKSWLAQWNRRSRRQARAAAGWLVRNLVDVVFVAGVAAIALGFGLAWLPLGFIVGGAISATVAYRAGGGS